jgi:hypothetical protein
MKLSYIESKIFGKVCYGFRRNKDGIVETIPDKAKVVELIFLLYRWKQFREYPALLI